MQGKKNETKEGTLFSGVNFHMLLAQPNWNLLAESEMSLSVSIRARNKPCPAFLLLI